jgi:hypothetical protein
VQPSGIGLWLLTAWVLGLLVIVLALETGERPSGVLRLLDQALLLARAVAVNVVSHLRTPGLRTRVNRST